MYTIKQNYSPINTKTVTVMKQKMK